MTIVFLLCLLGLLGQAAALQGRGLPRSRVAMQAERINTQKDLDSPKVVNMLELEAGKKGVFCRCWQSGTFPLCDGTHAKHNEATGDNVGPLIVSVKKEA